jgi:excisionase family DNA binding protein
VSEYSTLSEVAERLKFSERKLREIIRQRDIPVLEAGRDIRFDARALSALEEALRRPCRSGSIDAKAVRTTKSTSRLGGSAYEQARRLLTEDSRAKRPRHSKQNSSDPPGTANVVALDDSRKRS